MLLIDLLDFTRQLLETGVENDLVLSLVVFSLQYLLVNHEYWKYKVKHVRWKITLKKLYVIRTFELMEIEGLELAIGSALDILYTMLSKFSKLCCHLQQHQFLFLQLLRP
ncbi:hypothetical protein CICLE_v10029869mg [Citrus x clementina]|uniref:Uncharacterized protein n=1 Tax=Citrus clementina TaxID=85681 RepID=V4S8S7_CITCL|nr:hypothetical protein CICLE_v10029869mg [Citrus x clementina]